MSLFGDDSNEMIRLLDDDTVEAMLTGEPASADLGPLSAFIDAVVAAADEPVPAPSAPLAVLLAEGFEPGSIRESEEVQVPAMAAVTVDAFPMMGGRRPQARMLGARVAGLSLVAKIGLGISAAAASVTAAGAAGVLPGPSQDLVARAVEAVTPFDLPDRDDNRSGTGDDPVHEPDPAEPGGVGPTVTTPTGEPGPDRVPPEGPATTGLDTSEQTPADQHVPDSVPSPPATSPPSSAPAGPGTQDQYTPSTIPTGPGTPGQSTPGHSTPGHSTPGHSTPANLPVHGTGLPPIQRP